MRCTLVHVLSSSARWLGLGTLFVALPLSMAASTLTTVNFDFDLVDPTYSSTGIGSGFFTYSSTPVTSDAGIGPYADSADGNLTALQLTYGTNTFTLGQALNVPYVFLPGNSTIPVGETYGMFALWVLQGTCTPGGTVTSYTATCTG